MTHPDAEPTDEVLVTRCKAELPHNTQSYERLVQRHMKHVYHTVYQVVANPEDAEEITQDVFLKVYNHMKKFEQQSSFSTWIYRIATNSALDALDKRKRRISKREFVKGQTDEKQAQESDQASSEDGPEEKTVQKELRECINRVFKKLQREHAEVLVMHDLNDLSYDEISHVLGAGLSAVKMRIHRARLAFGHLFLQFCG
jgi:RNA polymerase sigma-70 factor (ECF subfamily)